MKNKRIGLKVCGLMNEKDVKMCVDLGVDRLGLVTEFPSPVPWNITREQAAVLRGFIPKASGSDAVMVTGGSPEEIMAKAMCVKPDLVQMHFKGNLEDMTALILELHKNEIGTIGKYPTKQADQQNIFGTTDIPEIVRKMCEAGVDEILVDPRNPENADYKSLLADTNLVRQIKECSKVPVILAGGITPENVMEKWEECHADSVDVMNGSEDAPGNKSIEKIKKFKELLGE